MIPGTKKRVFNFNDLMMIVALGRKHLRLITLLVCLSCTGGLVYYTFARPVYWSRSLVRLDYKPLPLDSEKVFHDSNISTLALQLNMPEIVERTARKLGLNCRARTVTEEHIKKIAFKTTVDGNLEVEVWAYSYPLAKAWCETLVDQFMKYRDEKRAQYRDSIVKSYSEEMEQISKKLESTISDKFDFQTKKDITKTLIDLNQLKNIPSELVRVKQRIAEMDRVSQQLIDPSLGTVEKLSLIASCSKHMQIQLGQVVRQDSLGDSKAEGKKEDASSSPNVVVLPSAATDSNEIWEGLEKEQRRIRGEIREASAIYLPGHRKMVELDKELDKVNRKLDLEYEVAKNRFDLELQDLKNKERDLEAKLPEYQSVTKKHEKILQESQLYASGQLAWNGMYSEMAKQVEMLDWTADRERVNLQFLDLLEIKDQPVSPYKLRIFIAALAVGLALGAGVPFLIEYLDHTVTSIEEVESVFQLRGLGIIPQVLSAEQERPVLLDEGTQGDNNLVENFRVIRANLLSVGNLRKEPQVIMITSSMPKEGKTVVSSNLAISFAKTGAKTLIIDTDLRRGRLHRLFGLRKGPGLSGVLSGQTSIEEACRPTGKEGLTILTAGQHVESGTELLGTPRFAAIMAELRARYDRIIIDTPPVLGLSETSIIQSHVDGVLFVVWGGRTPVRNMKVALELLQANGANLYGFILNRLDLSATTNYYQYYYYSNDYYHNYHAIENA